MASLIDELTPILFPYRVSNDIPAMIVEFPDANVTERGETITPSQTLQAPKVTFPDAIDSAYYTVVMTDPDAPSRATPKMKEWVHWRVVNIKGSDLKKGDIHASGATLWEYVPAAPPEGTGPHRYVILLYRQAKGIVRKLESFGKKLGFTGNGRGRQNTTEWAKNKGLGQVLALNLFFAEHDASCADTYAKLK